MYRSACSNAARLAERRFKLQTTSGGSSDSELNELAVKPTNRFGGPGAQMTATPIQRVDVCNDATVDISAGGTFTGFFSDVNHDYTLSCRTTGTAKDVAYRLVITEPSDVRLTATADGKPVRLFLPTGASDYLRRAGYDFFTDVTAFDERTFAVDRSEITRTDRAYEDLVEDIGRFGFTAANRSRLDAIASQLQALAAADPGNRYRETQANIARIHQSVWRTRGSCPSSA